MKLKRLIKDISVQEVRGSREVEITGVCSNSKLVAPGNLFIAKKGKTVDGSRYIPEAISAGAAAILTDFFDPSLKNVTQLIHPDVSAVEPEFAAQYHQHPSDQLFMVGITGTNGKTTTAYLIKHLLDTFHGPCGLMGTIEYLIGQHAYQATHTTPDVTTNQKLLREMANAGCRSAVMEVTSHALDQGRVENIRYDVGIFTNLTPEHMDYHLTMESYCQAKNKLFLGLDPEQDQKKSVRKAAIANADDPYFRSVIKGSKVEVITYGIDSAAAVQAAEIAMDAKGSTFKLNYQGKAFPVRLPLPGRYNIYNCLAMFACGLSQGYPLDGIVQSLETMPQVPGRLERVPNPLGCQIYVDFAHTPDALESVLQCLREFHDGRIITVFGCGGDRDRQKRPMMGKVSAMFSSYSIVTSDNPRSEEPLQIIQEIVPGFENCQSYCIEPDRRKAIEMAIDMATPDTIVLIAGRGHERCQILSHSTIDFEDRKVAEEICQQLSNKG